MKDRIIAIDYSKCTGCRFCETACTVKNLGRLNPERSRIRIVKIHEEGDVLPIPVVCMKCIKAACKTVCPAGAISDDPKTGARITDERKCIGCSACVYACPFGAIAVDRTLGHSCSCHHCGGEPTCVEFCPTGAIQYLQSDEVNIRLRRSNLNKYVKFLNPNS